jgi:hypothetical protein
MNGERINDLRRRVAAGEEVPTEEFKAALAYYVALRGQAVLGAKTKEPKAPKKPALSPEQANDLLKNFI